MHKSARCARWTLRLMEQSDVEAGRVSCKAAEEGWQPTIQQVPMRELEGGYARQAIVGLSYCACADGSHVLPYELLTVFLHHVMFVPLKHKWTIGLQPTR